MATVSGTVTSTSAFSLSNSTGGTTYTGSPRISYSKTFSNVNVTKFYQATLSVGTSPTTIDVTSLTDPFGDAVNFATIKHIEIVNNSTTADLTAGGGSNPIFNEMVLKGQAVTAGSAGSCLNLTSPITVDGTHKNLALTSSSGTISVDLLISGV